MTAPYVPTGQRAASHTLPDDSDAPSAVLFNTPFESIADEARYAADLADANAALIAPVGYRLVDFETSTGAQNGTFLVQPTGNSGYNDVLTVTFANGTDVAGDLLVIAAYAEGERGGSNAIERFDWRIEVRESTGAFAYPANQRQIVRATGNGNAGFDHDLVCVKLAAVRALAGAGVAQLLHAKLQFSRNVPPGGDTAQGNIGVTTNCHLHAYLLRAV